MLAAILRAILLTGGIIARFGRFLLPWLGRFATPLGRLFALLAGSWTRLLTFVGLPLLMGTCKAGVYDNSFSSLKVLFLETRSMLFSKLAEPFPAWVQNLGAFVNTVFPFDTAFTALGLVLSYELALISFGLIAAAWRRLMLINAQSQQ